MLPFLDLTEGMNQEPFADGMTEELIDKLSKIPGLRVPAPTSSFYFKGKQIHRRRYRQDAGCRLCTRWERAQVRRQAAGRRAVDSCGQRVRGLV